MDLALDNLQRLISHKTQQTKPDPLRHQTSKMPRRKNQKFSQFICYQNNQNNNNVSVIDISNIRIILAAKMSNGIHH